MGGGSFWLPSKIVNNSDFWVKIWVLGNFGPKSPKTSILAQKSLLLTILEEGEYVHPQCPQLLVSQSQFFAYPDFFIKFF